MAGASSCSETAAAASSATACASAAPPSGVPGTWSWRSPARPRPGSRPRPWCGPRRWRAPPGRASAPAAGARPSSRSIRASSALVDGSCAGSAALTSTSSSWVRASAPSFIARRAAAISSSRRTTSIGATVFACAASRSSCSGVTRSSAGSSPSACTTISARACASRSPKKRPRSRPESASRDGGEQRRPHVAGGDRVDGAEHEVGVGGAEHREHVLERDLAARVGDELLERAERVAERAGGRAGDQRRRLVADLDLLGGGHACGARRRSAARSAARSRTGGSGRRPSAAPWPPRSWRARRSCAAAAPRASSGTRSTPPWRACAPRRGCRPCGGRPPARSSRARAGRGCRRPSCWTRRPSRSRRATSPSAIERHDSHSPHGVTVGPSTQFSDAARIFAIEVLPVPREPTNRYAWWTLPCSIALRSVRTTWSWPTTSSNVRGRWRRYSEAGATGLSSLEAATDSCRLELPQRAVNAAFDGRQRLAEHLRDLGHGEVGAEAQRDRLALLGAQRGQRAAELVAVLDRGERVDLLARACRPARARASPPRPGGRGRAARSARSRTATSSATPAGGRTGRARAARARTRRPAGPRPAPGRRCGRRGTRTARPPRPRTAARTRRRASDRPRSSVRNRRRASYKAVMTEFDDVIRSCGRTAPRRPSWSWTRSSSVSAAGRRNPHGGNKT